MVLVLVLDFEGGSETKRSLHGFTRMMMMMMMMEIKAGRSNRK